MYQPIIRRLSIPYRSVRFMADTCKTPTKLPKVCPVVYATQGSIKIVSVTTCDVQPVANLIERTFVNEEPLCAATGISTDVKAKEELTKFICPAVEQGVSLVAKDCKRVIGAIVNVIIKNGMYETFYRCKGDDAHEEGVKEFCKFMSKLCDAHTKLKDAFILHSMFLVVDENFRGHCVGKLLVKSTMKMLRMMNQNEAVKVQVTDKCVIEKPIPTVYTIGFTSHIGEKIGMDMKMESLKVLRYKDFIRCGKTYADWIGSPMEQKAILMRATPC